MAFNLSNGVVLPDPPAEITEAIEEKGLYAVIIEERTASNKGYYLLLSSSVYGHVDSGLLGLPGGSKYIASFGYGAMVPYYNNVWDIEDSMELDEGENSCPIGTDYYGAVTLVWTNHVVYDITSIDMSNKEFTTGDVYFSPSSLSYPDEIPAWVLNSYPYVSVFRMDISLELPPELGDLADIFYEMYGDVSIHGYALYATSSEMITNGTVIKCFQPDYISAFCNYGQLEWEWGYDSTGTFDMEIGLTSDIIVSDIALLWANHDIKMANVDENDNWTVTDEIYYAGSGVVTLPENYSIEHNQIVSLARGLRRVTGTIEGFSLEKMAESLAAVPSMSALQNSHGKMWHIWKDNSDESWPKFRSEIYYANGIFVAQAVEGGSGLYWSEDFITWHISNITRSASIQGFICGQWIAQDTIDNWLVSRDGKTWESVASSIPSSTNKLVHANGLWIRGTNKLYYSEDMINWTQCASAGSSFDCIEYANGLWVAATRTPRFESETGGFYYSEDGKTWTKVEFSNSIDGVDALIFANGIWVAGSRTTYVGSGYYSTDGKTWNSTSGLAGYVNEITYANGVFVAATSNAGGDRTDGGIYYSTDGINWTRAVRNSSCRCVKYMFGTWVVGGSAGVYCSIDGINWEEASGTSGVANIWNANGVWIAQDSWGFGDTYWYSPSLNLPT